MRILVSAPWYGGAGGMERAIASIMTAASAEHEVTGVVSEIIPGPWRDEGLLQQVTLNSSWRWTDLENSPSGRRLGQVVTPLRRWANGYYDLHLAIGPRPNLTGLSRVGVRVLIPGGLDPGLRAAPYDVLAMEAPSNIAFLAASPKRTTLLPPPFIDLADHPVIVQRMPKQFLLTVFNPYGPIKGADRLMDLADVSPVPIVWCHSNATIDFTLPERLGRHPNIIHVEDASREELRYLYEQCWAYVSTSRSEGFGWAVVDALRHSPRVISTATGVMSFPWAAEAPGVVIVDEPWSVDQILTRLDIEPIRGTRDLADLSPQAFRRRMRALVDPGSPL